MTTFESRGEVLRDDAPVEPRPNCSRKSRWRLAPRVAPPAGRLRTPRAGRAGRCVGMSCHLPPRTKPRARPSRRTASTGATRRTAPSQVSSGSSKNPGNRRKRVHHQPLADEPRGVREPVRNRRGSRSRGVPTPFARRSRPRPPGGAPARRGRSRSRRVARPRASVVTASDTRAGDQPHATLERRRASA